MLAQACWLHTRGAARYHRHMHLRALVVLGVSLPSLACADAGGDTDSTTDDTSESSGDGDGDPGDGDGDGDGEPGDGDGEPLEGYDDPALWLCHPDKAQADDQCRGADLRATQIHPNGSTTVVEHLAAVDPEFDCFYIYPTVDLRLAPGQTETFDDISQELDPLPNQAARFTSMCRMFAPLYHQVTIGTFGSNEAETLLDAAYQDVEAAFVSWRDHHLGDRRFVIMGHSQGTYLTTRLLQEQIEPDPELRARLILGLMIGGGVGVPNGELVGGTFSQLPLCSAAGQSGCVLAYRSYAVELPPGPGDQTPQGVGDPIACTDAAALVGGGKLSGAYLPTFTNQPAVFVPIDYGVEYDTPFVLYRDLYTSRCETDVDGHQYLAIGVEPGVGDVRQNPIDFGQPLLNPGLLGLHVFDYNFALGDLLELVEQAAAAD
jgi:hypothetical protein